MQIFIRTTKLVATNVSDLIDRAENPSKMLRLLVVEIEEALIAAECDRSKLLSKQKALIKKVAALEKAQEDWTAKAKFAMSKDRADLAERALLEREKVIEQTAEKLTEIVAIDADAVELGDCIAKLNIKLAEARQRQHAVSEEMQTPTTANAAHFTISAATARAENALDRLDRLERRVDFAEAKSGARVIDKASQSIEQELAEMSRDAKVQASLEALKKAATKKASN